MPVKLIKLTDGEGKTQGRCLWGVGVTLTIAPKDRKREFCGPGVFHAYRSVDQGLLLNPGQGAYPNPRVWRATSPRVVDDDGTKVICWQLTILEELEYPSWYTDPQTSHRVRVRLAVLCARAVLPIFQRAFPHDERPAAAIAAAERWLSAAAAHAAAAARADAYAASYAAASAASAAYAAYAASAAHAAYAAHAASYAAAAAHAAAHAASYAASYAASADAHAHADAYAYDNAAAAAADERLNLVALAARAVADEAAQT